MVEQFVEQHVHVVLGLLPCARMCMREAASLGRVRLGLGAVVLWGVLVHVGGLFWWLCLWGGWGLLDIRTMPRV